MPPLGKALRVPIWVEGRYCQWGSVTPARNSRCNSRGPVSNAGVSKQTGDGAALVTKASGYQRGYQATGRRGAGMQGGGTQAGTHGHQGGLAG